jgi:hypothetical protein
LVEYCHLSYKTYICRKRVVIRYFTRVAKEQVVNRNSATARRKCTNPHGVDKLTEGKSVNPAGYRLSQAGLYTMFPVTACILWELTQTVERQSECCRSLVAAGRHGGLQMWICFAAGRMEALPLKAFIYAGRIFIFPAGILVSTRRVA